MADVDPVSASRRPGGELGRYVERLWYQRGTGAEPRETIAPTGSVVGALVLGDPLLLTPHTSRPPTPAARLRGEQRPFRAASSFLLGPHDRPVEAVATGETHVLGLVTTPVGCAAAVHVPPGLIRGRVVNLLAAWSGAAAVRRQIEGGEEHPERMLDALEEALAASLAAPGHGVARCARAVALLDAAPTTPVHLVAREVGISPGHLDREFARIVGLPPATYAGLVRVRRLLERVDEIGTPAWDDHAATLGWSDAARLERDVVRSTGRTPAEHAAGPAGRAGPAGTGTG